MPGPTERRSPEYPAEPGVDLGQVAHALWLRRWLIAATMLAGALLGLGASALGTRYVSEGLLLLPSLSVSDYKRYESALANAPRMEAFLAQDPQRDPVTTRLLRSLSLTPGAMGQAVRPEFTFTDRDARMYGVRPKDQGGLIGVRLRLSQSQKDDSAALMTLAEYVRDTAIKLDSELRLLKWCHDYRMRELELRSEQLQTDFLIEQQSLKLAGLRALIERTPGAAQIDNRQLVSLENGGERYLSPLAQIVAAEVLSTDYALTQSTGARALVVAGLKQDYYCRALAQLQESGSGREFLQRLGTIHEQVLAGKDRSQNVIEQTAHTLQLQRERWTDAYLVRTRFVVSPEGAQVRVRSPGRVVGVVLGTLVGLFAGVVLSLLLAWWRQNRAVIVAPD